MFSPLQKKIKKNNNKIASSHKIRSNLSQRKDTSKLLIER